jgi:hypothetical protein
MPTVTSQVMWGDIKYAIVQHRRKNYTFIHHLSIEIIVLLVVSVALAFLNFTKFIVIFQIPHLFAQWGIVTLNLIQHDGCEVDSMEDPDTRKNGSISRQKKSYNTSRYLTDLVAKRLFY